jgi:hypothetical protein
MCGASDAPPQAHHSDYAKRFDVAWLCVRCHAAVHTDTPVRVRTGFRLPADLLAAVDAARGDVSRTQFVVRALERALGDDCPGSSVTREMYASPLLERQLREPYIPVWEKPPVLDEAQASEVGKVRVYGPAETYGHLPKCTCAVCKPPKS